MHKHECCVRVAAFGLGERVTIVDYPAAFAYALLVAACPWGFL